MPEGPVIRLATRADAATIHDLVLALAHSRGKTDQVVSRVEDIQRHGFGAEPAFEALIAEVDGQAVGLCLYFDSFSTWDGCRGVYVQDIFVAQAQRGTGLGRRLLAETAARAAGRGGSYLRLAVDAANVAAQDFYAHIGLHYATEDRIYQVRGADFKALAQDRIRSTRSDP